MYRKRQGVEKDKKRELYHLEEAAIGGDPGARHDLAIHEAINDKIDIYVQVCFIPSDVFIC